MQNATCAASPDARVTVASVSGGLMHAGVAGAVGDFAVTGVAFETGDFAEGQPPRTTSVARRARRFIRSSYTAIG